MKKYGWVAASLIASGVYLVYALVQPVYTYALLDPRFDAHQYARSYYYFKGAVSDYRLSFPFNTRILSPWLAAHLPFHDLETNFIWLNGFFIVATVGLLTRLWWRLQLKPWWIAVALFWLLFHWKGLVRMYLPDPVTADVGGYFWLTSSLALLLRQGEGNLVSIKNRNKVLLLIVVVFGTLQKEYFVAVTGTSALWYGVAVFQEKEKSKGTFLLFLSAFVLSIGVYWLLTLFLPAFPQDWRNNGLVSLLRGLKRYVLQPELFLRLPVGWLLAYGSFWLALFAGDKVPSRYSFLTAHCWLWLFLSVLGGGDTTRILFNGMPFVLTFFLLKLHQQPAWVSTYVCLTSLPFLRLMRLEPDLGRYPVEMHQWCVECWPLGESWGYVLYAAGVLAGYYYFLRRFGTVGRSKSDQINTGR